MRNRITIHGNGCTRLTRPPRRARPPRPSGPGEQRGGCVRAGGSGHSAGARLPPPPSAERASEMPLSARAVQKPRRCRLCGHRCHALAAAEMSCARPVDSTHGQQGVPVGRLTSPLDQITSSSFDYITQAPRAFNTHAEKSPIRQFGGRPDDYKEIRIGHD